MPHHVTLEIGSKLWFLGLAATVITGAAILFLSQKLSGAQLKKLRFALAILFSINFIAFHTYAICEGSWNIVTSLPFHLCSLSQIIGIAALLTLNQRLFELVAYFGIAGGVNSLMTPEFAHGYDRFYHVQYYFEHGGIILMPLFLGLVYKMKPRKLTWLKIMATVNFLALGLYFFNRVNGSNYMYVNVKPIADSPFLVGDWPYYILALELVVLVHFYFIYVLFHKFKNWV